jgi:RimJ/RimL family protein N-acetyltransferase
MKLETSQLTLRPLMPSDRKAFCRVLSDPCVHRTLQLSIDPKDSAALARMFVERRAETINGRPSRLGILLRRNDAFIGSIGAYEIDGNRIGLSYWLDASFQGRGLGSEALVAFSQCALAAYGRTLIQANVADTNLASIGALKRAGYGLAKNADDPAFGALDRRLLFVLPH